MRTYDLHADTPHMPTTANVVGVVKWKSKPMYVKLDKWFRRRRNKRWKRYVKDFNKRHPNAKMKLCR